MTDSMIENVKAAIAERFAPAIDFKAPYAKVMLEMAARAAIQAHEAALKEAGYVIVPTPIDAALKEQP